MADRIPPYVAYRTFRTFLSQLSNRGLPSRVDRSVMASKSGSVQSRLLLALSYLGLIGANGRPTPDFRRLAEAEGDSRTAVLREIVTSSYAFIFTAGINLADASSSQIEELFEKTGASGGTLRRAVSFFLSLAREAGVPVSPYIKPHRNKRRRARSAPDRPEAPANAAGDPTLPFPETCGKEIALRSGGSLKLEMDLNLFDLDASDREFVFHLIDAVNRYPKPD